MANDILHGPCVGEPCWYNPETGYIEYCSEHESQMADAVYGKEKADRMRQVSHSPLTKSEAETVVGILLSSCERAKEIARTEVERTYAAVQRLRTVPDADGLQWATCPEEYLDDTPRAK